MNKYFEINSQTSLKYDTDCNKFYTNNNNKIYEHSMYPMVLNDSTTNRNKYIQSSDVNGILQSNNYDAKGAVIDDSTKIRFGEMTDQDGKKELPTRIFQGVPYMGAGQSVLKNTDLSSRLIYAEDTRVSRTRSQRYELSPPMRSYREAADRYQVERIIAEIIALLKEGKSVAYVSDAGTPGVSDPGDYLVKKVVEAGFSVVPIPGASALAAILSISGMNVQRPLFVGFLPRKKGHQTLMKKLRAGLTEEMFDGLVFYESPERVIRTLEELLEWKLELEVCIGRELTKQFEQIIRGTPESALEQLRAIAPRGEFVILIKYHA